MSGVPAAIHQAFALVRVGGRVQMLGIPAKPMEVNFATEVIFKGITIYGVVGRRMYDTWHQMTRFLRSGEFDPTPVITHRFPLERSRRGDARDQVRRSRQSHLRDRLREHSNDRLTNHTPGMALNKHSRPSSAAIEQLKTDSVYKRLNYLESPQAARVKMEGRGEVLILSSNNYLGLCDEPTVVEAGIDGLRRYGAGTAACASSAARSPSIASWRRRIARFVGTEASLSFVSAWNANEGLTATIVEEGDFVVSDALNHASIIDSMRLAKAITKCTTAVYKHADMDDLEAKLEQAKGAQAPAHLDRRRLLDGRGDREASRLLQIARDHDAIVAVDDSHATGVLGETGRGTAEHFGVLGEVDVITSTLGKALGGAAGGFVAGSAALCDMLTQRSRPQLFSNALPPTVAAARSRRSSSSSSTPSAWRSCATTRATSASDHRGGVQAAARRHADRPDHRRRDGAGDPDE